MRIRQKQARQPSEVPVMVALRLFLPDSWISDRRRLERAGAPAEYRNAGTKPEIALSEISKKRLNGPPP
jgi:hypothetical protein